ncbi:MAG: fructose-bisphosphatase class III, partial [Spirochaetaceae bacterium]|nr:fructose-bisphosphatase class III [Spirochaetaceae bacterium]
MDKNKKDALALLARQYNSVQKASTEVINLSAILNLPKGTEHFLSDIHGESEAFLHVLKNGSGSVRRKIEEVFSGTLMEEDKRHLASLIFYPEQRVPLMLKGLEDKDEFFKIMLFRLIKICRIVTSKYTRSKVRKALPEAYSYIIEELLHEQE